MRLSGNYNNLQDMTRQTASTLPSLNDMPDAPGVYYFLGKNKKILYIGRATSLRSRVRSYFNANLGEKRSAWIAKMLTEARSIDVTKTDSVLEAILLEVDLIKKFQPPYNTQEKDDKSFNCVIITSETFPRVLVIRKRNINFVTQEAAGMKLRAIYGPFTSGAELTIALKLVRRIFPYRDRCEPNQGRACFNRQIGLCPGVCTGEINKEEYAKTIRNLQLFFQGKKQKVLASLRSEMSLAVPAMKFERAGDIKRTMFALQHIQDVALLKNPGDRIYSDSFRIEAYDLSHFGGKEIVGAMVVVEDGVTQPDNYRLFRIKTLRGPNEVAGLWEMLRRRLTHSEWPLPRLIVADGNEVQKNAIEKILREHKLSIPVVAVTKDHTHTPNRLLGDERILTVRRREILLANSEAHRFSLNFQRRRRARF